MRFFAPYSVVLLFICFATWIQIGCENKSSRVGEFTHIPTTGLDLEKQVYLYNNELQYDSSITLIRQYLERHKNSPEELYYGYLNLSFTYKRLFDYDHVLIYLDSALVHGKQTDKQLFFENNILAQKSMAYFDLQQFGRADSLIAILKEKKYLYLNDEDRSKLWILEGYSMYLKKAYLQAEQQYMLAIERMKKSSPCDLPMVYCKQMQLYAAMNDSVKEQRAFNNSMTQADSCGILKYKHYTAEVALLLAREQKKSAKILVATSRLDSINLLYREKENLIQLSELDKKFQLEKQQQQILFDGQVLRQKNTFIALLIVSLILILFGILFYFVWRSRQKIKQHNLSQIKYTNQLIQRIEEERKRIATDLHDEISHDLLSLKRTIQDRSGGSNNQIDTIINNIRSISRNLHPAMFETLGLKISIEQLAERIQQTDQFVISLDIDYAGGLPSFSELQIYRIVQEAMTNTIKYANAHAAKITIQETSKTVQVEIRDNGTGFDVDKKLIHADSFGLHNIIERSEAIGGKANIESNKHGTIITIEIYT